MFNKILVPLDGSELARGILPYVSRLAKGMDTPVLLLTVLDPDAIELPSRMRGVPSDSRVSGAISVGIGGAATTAAERPASHMTTGTHPHEGGGPFVSQIFENAEAKIKAALEKIAKELATEGVTATSKVVFGKGAEKIAEVARDEGADLIAMSTHGRNAIGRGILGSVTDKVLHIGHVPVLTITPEKAKKYEGDADITKVLIPLDGSETAEVVLPYIEDMAIKMALEVTLVRVVKIGGALDAYSDGYTYFGVPDLEAELEVEATEYIKGVADKLKAKGLKVGWKVMKGAPAICITDIARDTPHDLIALATHGRSGLTRWVIGSVAEALVRSSGDPVIVIPPETKKE